MHEAPTVEIISSKSAKEILVMDNLGELTTPEEAEEISVKPDRTRVSPGATHCSKFLFLGLEIHFSPHALYCCLQEQSTSVGPDSRSFLPG
jgi:hypothetical protein